MCRDSRDSKEERKVTRTVPLPVGNKKKRSAEMKSLIDLTEFKVKPYSEIEASARKDAKTVIKSIENKNNK